MKSRPQSAAGELLMLRLSGPRWSSSLERQLRTLAPAGILLAAPLPRSPEILCRLLAEISRCLPTPPILAIEEEGGDHDPLSALLPALPSPRSIAQRGPRAARLAAEMIGEAAKLLGFNTNLAPCLDLAPASNLAPDPGHAAAPGEGMASAGAFGQDPAEVKQCGRFWIEGQERHKILSCAKHFPGLASVPPHDQNELPISGRSMADLWALDLVPYRELLRSLPMVMMSAAVYKAYDFNYARSAALSPLVVEGLLRVKLGYQGVVVAPDLGEWCVRGVLNLSDAAVQAIHAGCDLLVVDEEQAAIQQGLAKALDSGRISSERFDQARGRIQAMRQRLSPPAGKVTQRAWHRLAQRFEEFNSGD